MSSRLPISDNHIHVWREMPMEELVKFHKNIIEEFGYEEVTYVSINEEAKEREAVATMPSLKTLYLKKILSPRVYAYASLHMAYGNRKATAEDFLEQAKLYKKLVLTV